MLYLRGCPPPPSQGNRFAAVMALLINHHKLQPSFTIMCGMFFSCALRRCPLDLVWTPQYKLYFSSLVINGSLSYTNMLIIHVWENTDRWISVHMNRCVWLKKNNKKKQISDNVPWLYLGTCMYAV